jgi:predicted Zn-dependent peptidase
MALFLEADRMRALEITPEGLEAAKRLLLEERRARFDNFRFGPSLQRLRPALFNNFANQQTGFGSVEDIRAITIEDARSFYQTHFSPSNAALALVGDFTPAQARERVRHYFEGIPSRPKPPEVDTSEPATQERREVFADPSAPSSVTFLLYRGPSTLDPDWFVLKSICELLGGYPAARLNTELVKNAGVAAGIEASIEDSTGPTAAVLTLILAPGKDPAQALKLFDEEISRLQREGATAAELERRRTDALLRRALNLASTRNRALMMSRFHAIRDAGIINRWEDQESRVTNDSIRRVAQKYLASSNRVVIEVPAAGGRK